MRCDDCNFDCYTQGLDCPFDNDDWESFGWDDWNDEVMNG